VGEFHADASESERGIHDARLAMETEKLIRDAGILAKDLSRIGLIIGPGSFTGLRIGLAFAKGLAFASDAGIVPMTQHEVLRSANPDFEGYIITPGYRPDMYYLAEENSLRHILLVTAEDIAKLLSKPILALDKLEELSGVLSPAKFGSPKFAPFSLAAMARMTSESKPIVTGIEIDSMEPLYLTEFKPG